MICFVVEGIQGPSNEDEEKLVIDMFKGDF